MAAADEVPAGIGGGGRRDERIFYLGALGHRDRVAGTPGNRRLPARRSNLEQVFRAGGSWHSLGNSRIYLNPEVTNLCLALAWIRQGDHQQKQHDGHGKNEQLVRH